MKTLTEMMKKEVGVQLPQLSESEIHSVATRLSELVIYHYLIVDKKDLGREYGYE